jgi:hypothetical protein
MATGSPRGDGAVSPFHQARFNRPGPISGRTCALRALPFSMNETTLEPERPLLLVGGRRGGLGPGDEL